MEYYEIISADGLTVYRLPVSEHLRYEHRARWLWIYGHDRGRIAFTREVARRGERRTYIYTTSGLVIVVGISTERRLRGQLVVITAFALTRRRLELEAAAAGFQASPAHLDASAAAHREQQRIEAAAR